MLRYVIMMLHVITSWLFIWQESEWLTPLFNCEMTDWEQLNQQTPAAFTHVTSKVLGCWTDQSLSVNCWLGKWYSRFLWDDTRVSWQQRATYQSLMSLTCNKSVTWRTNALRLDLIWHVPQVAGELYMSLWWPDFVRKFKAILENSHLTWKCRIASVWNVQRPSVRFCCSLLFSWSQSQSIG